MRPKSRNTDLGDRKPLCMRDKGSHPLFLPPVDPISCRSSRSGASPVATDTFTSMCTRSVMVFMLLLAIPGTKAQEPQDRGMLALRSDICRCMEALDPEASDAVYERGFRTCLGEGVLRHPGEVRTLLKDSPEVGSSGYRLGISIGTLMRNDCPAYQRALARVRTSLERSEGAD